jgi:dipeptidyl aminopeptidase/acylaminoacyl peptidase
MPNTCRYLCLLSILMVSTAALEGQAALPAPVASFPTNEQLRHFKAMSDPRLSPDGRRILVRITEPTADGAKSHLWLLGTKDEEPRQLTYSVDADKAGEHDGNWMPDGKSLLFLAKRGEHTSLYRLPMDGGEAEAFDLKIRPVVDESKLRDALPPKDEAAKGSAPAAAKVGDEVAIDVSEYRISPDGKWVAIIAADPQTAGEKAEKEAKADAEWVDHDPHGSRLYLLDMASRKLAPVAVEPDVHGVDWSNDSARLLAVAESPNNAGDLGPAASAWIVTATDTSHAEKVAALPATVESAVWSLDGKSIIYLAQARHDAPPGYSDLYRYDVEAKATHNLSDGFRGSMGRGEPVSLADGSVVELTEEGFSGKVAVFGAGAEPEFLRLDPHNIADLNTNVLRNGWLFLGSSGGKPEALYFTADLHAAPTQVKTPALAPERILSVSPKQLAWKSDGLSIEGRLYLPPEAATKHVPLIVEVHGGPLGAYADAYEPWIDFLLGQGWAVLRTNPRGSSGYGAAFAAANKNDLGGGDYRDIMAGVDFVVKTEPIDVDRMALMGYSYGGEMAGFVEGKTQRFKAIISGAPVIDQHSEYGTESSSWYDRWYFGKPWEHPEDAWRQSPLAMAGKAKTPFLLLQGQSDTTDPLGQSQEMYRALRQMGTPVELVTYPRDDHGPLARALYGQPVPEPWHGFDARRRVVEFIQRAFNGTVR